MFTGQGELGQIVIEIGIVPVACRMAQLAILRQSGGDVIRAGGRLVLLQMARRAIGGERRVLIIHMASEARGGGMFAGERELGRRVIELCI